MKIQKIMLAAAGLLFACSASAVDGFVRQGDLGGWSWSDPKYWTDADGQPLGTYPHEAGDTASLACVSNNFRTAVFNPQTSFTSFALASLSGGYMTYLNFVTSTKQTYPAQRLVIDDPDDFAGWWGTHNDLGRAEIVLNATAAHSPRLSALSVTGRNGLSVPAGTTASVGTLAVASSAALVKEGDGTLEIGSFATPQQNIQVNAGNVRFSGNAALPLQPQPAADPYAWFDADNGETLQTVVSNDNGETYTFVTNWLDCRPDARNPRGKRMSLRNQQNISDSRCHGGKADSAWPTLDGTSFARPMVDLGPFYNQTSSKDFGWNGGSSGLSTWLRLLQEDALMGATIREGFVVFVKTHSYSQPIAAADWTFRTAGADYNSRCWVNSSYADGIVAAGLWWCDGVPVDGTASAVSGDNKAHLGHFALSYMRSANALGVDMNITGNGCGGCKIAEVIYYDRCLTDEERRETERYLMQKWNVGTHPADQPAMASLAYAAGQSARLATDRDISLASLTADAVLEKSGAGKLTVVGAMPEQTSLKVENGALDLNVDIAAGAFMHVDAERVDSLVFDKGAYDPTDPTNLVTRWNDWRGNGWYAHADNTYKTAHPNYRKVMINGVEKPCLDFGDYVFTTSKLPGTTAASMAWSKEPKFLHGFIVCADSAKVANSTEDRQSIFGERDMAFFRFSKPYIIGTYSNENQKRIRSDDAYIGVNGEKKSYNWTVPYQTFHVFAFSPTNAMTAVNWFAQSRGDRFGGQQICEAIVFETDISVERRTAIEKYLMKKWLGLGDGAGWEQPMDEVSVANGATLKLRNDAGMIGPVTKLAGRGSVTMTQITNLSEVVVGDASGQAGTLAVAADVQVRDGAVLKVVIDEAGKVGGLAVEGTLSFAGDVRVVLEKTGVTKTLCGEYTILSATELEGLDAAAFADWTFDTSVETRRNISFRYDATTKSVVMTVSPTGLLLIVR